MTEQNKNPQAGDLRGLDKNTQIISTTPDENTAITEINPNSPEYVLHELSRYLLEVGLGSYALTASAPLTVDIEMVTLAVYASHFGVMPFSLTSLLSDTAGLRLVEAACILSAQGRLTAHTASSRECIHLSLRQSDTDKMTTDFLDSQILPSRARIDVASMRRRLIASAKENIEKAYANGSSVSHILTTLTTLAGEPWPDIATLLLQAGLEVAR